MNVKKLNELFGDDISDNIHWIFTYGSLSNSKLRSLLVEDVQPLIPCKIDKKTGYKRKWILNKALNSITSGIFPDLNPVDINGMIFPVKEGDFIKIDDYEHGYKKVEMNWNAILIDNKEQYSNSKLWIYLPDQKYVKPDFYKLLPTIYVDYCMEGFKEVSEDYMIEFIKTTD